MIEKLNFGHILYIKDITMSLKVLTPLDLWTKPLITFLVIEMWGLGGRHDVLVLCTWKLINQSDKSRKCATYRTYFIFAPSLQLDILFKFTYSITYFPTPCENTPWPQTSGLHSTRLGGPSPWLWPIGNQWSKLYIIVLL